jgi:hypothetical protein
MRALILLPIIHGIEDLGGLGEAVNNSRAPAQAEQHQLGIDHFWSLLESAIDGFGLDYKKLKLYQDGLPVCGKESEIVADTARSGSRNFCLLQKLMERGATLIGTESPELLLKEYALMRQAHDSQPGQTAPTAETAQALLDQRDTYIAQRINDTLKEGEMGLLFIGLLHKVEDKLPKDITIIQPIEKPAIGSQ